LAHSFAEKKKRQEVWDTELALKLGKSEKFFFGYRDSEQGKSGASIEKIYSVMYEVR
jgi:hypothetical protein